MRKGVVLTALSLLAACLPAAAEMAPVPAQLYDSATPRDMGMGGAVTAVADDLSVVLWNPAAAAQIQQRQILYSDSLGTSPKGLRFASYGQPPDEGMATGVLSYLRVVNNVYGMKETTGMYTFGQEISDGLAAGVSLKYSRYLRRDTAKQAFNVDAGVLYSLSDNTTVGATVLNVTEPRTMNETVVNPLITPPSVLAPLYAPRMVNVGIAYRIHPYVAAGKLGVAPLQYRTLLCLDVYGAVAPKEVRRELRFGVEHQLSGRLVARAGLMRSTPTLGFGYTVYSYRVDGAVILGRRGQRSAESVLSASTTF